MAHPVPQAVRADLWARLAPYRAAHRDVRWTRPQSWHLTLVFLGAVDPVQVPALRGLVEDVAAGTEPYRVEIERGGGRSRQGEGVAWLGLTTGAGSLIEVAGELAAGCPPDVTDGARVKRTPSAHLTLVRRADEAVIKSLRDGSRGSLQTGWTVDGIELVRSHLEPTGARYETLHRSTL